MGKLLKNLEVYLASIMISITVITVVSNVFLRYLWGIQFSWVEELSVGSFIWTVFLGAAAAYKNKALIGVDFLSQFLPKAYRRIFDIVIRILMLVVTGVLFYLSWNYTLQSKKITAALEVSYIYINSALVVSFALIFIYSLLFLIEDIRAITKRED